MKESPEELEMDEPEDEADRKHERPSEMDIKVLYTRVTYSNVSSGLGLLWLVLLLTRQRRGLCRNCSGC